MKIRPALLPVLLAFFVVVLLSAGGTAFAQASGGLRAGVSADPDQFYFGGHLDTGFLVERLSFRPNAEIGLGDNVTTVAVNFEFVYWFPLPDSDWRIYTGGGPALNVYRVDRGEDSDTDTEPGFNILVGLAHRGGLFTEFKLGLIDSPEVKFGIGFTF